MPTPEDRTTRITSPPVDVGGAPLGVEVLLVILAALILAVVMSAIVWRIPPPKD